MDQSPHHRGIPRPGARKHVVIVGSGFGGLQCARALAGKDVDVTLIDKRNHYTFQPLLYQVATAGLDSDDICYVTRGLVHRYDNVRATQATVTGVDTAAKTISIAEGTPLSYDQLVLAVGAVTADFGVPGVAQHAFGLKSAADAIGIRNQVLGNFERAARTNDALERERLTTVVIVGGGPTGVEMAGGFAELFDQVLERDFPELSREEPRVVLIEARDRLLDTFAPQLSAKALRTLRAMGVEVRTNTSVAALTEDHVVLGDGGADAEGNDGADHPIPADTVVWAAGVRANPLAEALGFETTRGGRIVVDDSLRVPDADDVFVIGDLAAATLDDGSLVPQVAPAAMQQGSHVARVILDGPAAAGAFRYRDKGSMATIGRNAAVVELPNGWRGSGFLGWVAWLALHLYMLIGFRNRANVLVNWAWNYLTWDRGSRIIVPSLEAERAGATIPIEA